MTGLNGITITETHESRPYVHTDSLERMYIILGTASESEAMSALVNGVPVGEQDGEPVYDGGAPETYLEMRRGKCSIEPVYIDEENPARCIWSGLAPYAPENFQRPQTGDSHFSFDTGGGTQHITQSLTTIGSYGASGAAPNFQGAIGVTHDSVEGVDITVPVYQFAETHYLPASQVTDVYKGRLFQLTGKVNNAAFRGLQAGECLFLGASGSMRGEGDWEIGFKFAGSPNRTGLSVGPISGISKKGWEYLWVRYADVEDTGSNTLVKQPVAAYVEKVYEDGDFSLLGIDP